VTCDSVNTCRARGRLRNIPREPEASSARSRAGACARLLSRRLRIPRVHARQDEPRAQVRHGKKLRDVARARGKDGARDTLFLREPAGFASGASRSSRGLLVWRGEGNKQRGLQLLQQLDNKIFPSAMGIMICLRELRRLNIIITGA